MTTFWEIALPIIEEKNISLAEIGRACGKDKATVHKWKKFDRFPPAECIPSIANLLNVNIEYLITGKSLSNEENEIKEILKNPELKKTIAIMQNLSEEDLSKFRAAFEAIAALSAAGDQPLGQGNAG